MIEYHKELPNEIEALTGITSYELKKKGQPLKLVIENIIDFIGDFPLVGSSINFDMGFLNYALRDMKAPLIKNKTFDLLKYIKKDKMFLKSYRLEEVLAEYDIDNEIEHRGLKDAQVIYDLTTKVNGFLDLLPSE